MELISRQAAIDALNSRKTAEQCEAGKTRNWTVDICVDMIKQLPPIQPEPHWIPVTEIPKEEEKSYWVCLEDGGQCQCRWTNDVYGIGANAWSKWGWKKVDLPHFSKVVAYMPLPEPFKGVKDGRD